MAKEYILNDKGLYINNSWHIYFIPYLGQSTKREGNVNKLLSFQR